MKKHHSIFSTKAVPDYKRKSARNPRADRHTGREDIHVSDYSNDSEENADDMDEEFVAYMDEQDEYDEYNEHDEANERDEYDEYNEQDEDLDMGKEPAAKTADAQSYESWQHKADEQLEDAISKVADETSGAYDTDFLKSVKEGDDFDRNVFAEDLDAEDERRDNAEEVEEQPYAEEESFSEEEDTAEEEYAAEESGYAEEEYDTDSYEDTEDRSYDESEDDVAADDLDEEEEKIARRRARVAAQQRKGRYAQQGKKRRRRAAKPTRNKFVLFLKNSNSVEKASMIIGLVVVLVVVALGSMIVQTRVKASELAAFDSVGSQLDGVNVIGQDGLVAISDAQVAKAAAAKAATQASTEASTASGTKVSLALATIKQDLKIKFLDASDASLISGVPFEAEVKQPDGSTTTWTDDDKDGIIYHSDIPAGTYTVSIKELTGDAYSDYTFNTKSQDIVVKENITYKAVDVTDEIKTEAEVNVAKEDTQVKAQDTTVESVNTDTVEWVESTKTEVGSSGTTSYEEIAKNTIVDPLSAKADLSGIQLMASTDATNSQASSAATTSAASAASTGTTSGGSSSAATTVTNTLDSGNFSMNVGDAAKTINATSTGSGVTVSWTSDNTAVATVAGNGMSAAVSAVAKGTANITAKFSSGNAVTVAVTVNASSSAGTSASKATYTLSAEKTSVAVGASVTITAKTSLKDATVTWASDTPAVATVDGGKITGVAKGTAKVTATFSDKTVKTVAVTVTDAVYTISSVTLTVANTSVKKMSAGTAGTLSAVTSPANGTVTFASSDATVLSISGTTATALKAGTATITATCGTSTKTLKVTVSASNGKIKMSAAKSTLLTGNTLQLTATVSNLSAATVTWASSDASVATVSDAGLVTAVKAGSATITATSTANTAVTATCAITVKDGAGELKDKNGNTVYVSDNGTFRAATTADYSKYTKFYIQVEGKLYKYTGWQTIDGYTYYYDKNNNFVTGDQVIQGAKYSFDSAGHLSTGSGVLGIDVSKWNGSINWASVKNSGISYVIIRCGYRGSSSGALIEDPKFRSNIKGATAAGLKVGVYFFTQATSDVEAVEEASMTLSLIKGYSISCPVFLDVESSHGRADGISASTRTAVCKAFCATMQNAGYSTGVYANKTWLNNYIDAGSLTGYKIWLAQYAATPTYSKTRYDMWQYTSSGSVAGISGRVDMNISYMNF